MKKSKRISKVSERVIHTTSLEENVTPVFNTRATEKGESLAIPAINDNVEKIQQLEWQLDEMRALLEEMLV